MTRIISTDEELQTLRDGAILLAEPLDGFSDSGTHPNYWITMQPKEHRVMVYEAGRDWHLVTMEELQTSLTVIHEPPTVEHRAPDSFRYKFEYGTLTSPHEVTNTRYTDRRSDVDEALEANGFWFARPKITDQTTGEVICEAWAQP